VQTPPLPEEARADLLDHDVRRSLRGLPSGLADTIARHLVATALLLDDDPAAALAHARAAADRVPRLAAVREAVGIAAYHAGEYATALLELRAARRMDGSAHNLPLMADSERGLGRPERAVAYLRDPQADELDPATRAELLIVVSGARRDLDQPEAAVVLLRDLAVAKGAPAPWTARLWYAYAEALLAADRPDDAARWFTSAAAIDDGETDAAARAYLITTGEPMPDEQDEVEASTSASLPGTLTAEAPADPAQRDADRLADDSAARAGAVPVAADRPYYEDPADAATHLDRPDPDPAEGEPMASATSSEPGTASEPGILSEPDTSSEPVASAGDD
jgi:tetratricopeptide (TPR) repeat protein